MMAGTDRPLPGCPAREGAGSFDVATADFLFHVADCRNGGSPDGPVTEIFGFFGPPRSQETDSADGDCDAVLTAVFEVPPGSPIARLAHQAHTESGAALIAETMRASVTACPCADPGNGCAALDELTFLAAIEHAAQSARPAKRRRRTTRGLWHE